MNAAEGNGLKRRAKSACEGFAEMVARHVHVCLHDINAEEAGLRELYAVGEAKYLIRLIDQLEIDAEHLARAWKGKRRARCYRWEINRVLANHKQRCLDRLRDLGVVREPFPVSVDFHTHDVVGVVTTSDPSKDGKVQSVVRHGYRRGDTVLRPAAVYVFKFNQTHNGG